MEQLIQIEYIQVNGEATDPFAAIDLAASVLIKHACIAEDYVKTVLEREKIFPTGLPSKIGTAIPHANSEDVFKSAISVLTLKDPLDFSEMGNPQKMLPVEIIFLLAVKDQAMQLEILQTIMKIIQDEKILEKIKGAQEPEIIYNLIAKFF